MGLTPIDIQPGIYTEASDRAAIGRWKNGFNIRFFKGNAEKVKGWQKQIATAMQGICRSLLAWTTLSYERLLALGTHEKLYLSDINSFFDITPLRSSGTLGADPFTTTLGSASVAVVHVAHGLGVGDHVHFSGATAVGGLDMNAEFVVDVTPDDDSYSFTHDSLATSAATGGGAAVAFEYEISAGELTSILGTGWGAGGWGIGTWGTSHTSAHLTIARIWSLVNWGEDLIASPVDRPIYVWVAATGKNTRATSIATAPAQNRRVILSPQLRILVSAGSHDGVDPDPMLIRWCDSEDYTDWTPSPTNTAGDKRFDNGSEILSAILSRNEIAVFTDTTIYSMFLTGDSLVFGFDDKGRTVGLAGPNATVDINGVVYAFGRGEFYTYDGEVKHLPCDVYSRVFGDFNIEQAAKVTCARNKTRNEIIWFYPSADSSECDLAVMYNYSDPAWALGDANFARTAWLDETAFFDTPVATAPTAPGATDSYLYVQETGVDADGAALPYMLESYDMEFSDSQSAPGAFLWTFKRLFPDFVRLVGNHLCSVAGRKKPRGELLTKGPVAFGEATEHIDVHLRARQISIKIEGAEIGNDIEMGNWRVDAAKKGGR